MIHLFKGINQLTNLEIEKIFSNTSSNTLYKKDLFIDLSQVRFAQLSAINYLVLKIESECKKGTIKTIYVSLPTIEFTTGERNSSDPNFTHDVKSKILSSRRNSNSFIKNTKFISALKQGLSIYGIEVFFTERYNFESQFQPDNFETAFEEIIDLETNKHFGYHYLYPLEWISINDIAINYEVIEEKFNQVLENSDRGLDRIDVNAIKNVIFSELSKNVKEHTSGKVEEKRFLLSIGLISIKSLRANKEQKSIEYEFLDWVWEEQIQSLVEIYFGDSGGGFFNQRDFLAKCKQENINERKEQLRWAFKKWTTKKFDEERRGTKGLYRINRIVNNYNGIFHIITNDQNGGFRKGGLKNEKWLHRKTISNFDGAFIQIKLCPFSAVKEFKFTLKESETNKLWKTINIDTNGKENEIIKYIQQEFKSENNLLSILDLDKSKRDESGKLNLLNNILLEISYNSHPSGAVVFINSSLAKDTIDTIINSINEFIKNKTSTDLSNEKDNEEIYDTVIVIHGNHTLWYGGNQHIIDILNEVYESSFAKTINELISFQSLTPEDKVRVRQSLENDNKLIHVNKKGELELNFTNLDSHFCKIIKENIALERQKESNKLISPKVEVLDYWLDVESILKDNEFGFGLALYLKALEFIKNQKLEQYKQEQLYILIDHRQHIGLANAIATLFGLSKKHLINLQDEIQNNSLKRFKLIPEKSNVIVLTSIIGSSETIRRLVKYVRRDNANPILILCLSNHRKNKINKLETWGNVTEIRSINTEYEKEQTKEDKNKKYFEVKNETLKKSKFNLVQPNYTFTEWKDKELLSYELALTLKESKSLNYNHIGINNDRHFTFYIDKYKLLNSKNIIWESVIRNIEEWKFLNKITEFTLYIKNDFLYNEVSGFIIFLKERYKNVDIYKSLPKVEIHDDLISFKIERDLNVFIIDFGLISGNTINSMLCNFRGLNNLFICIIFNQIRSNNHEHYKRLTTLDNSGYRATPTKLKIDFLFNFPLTHYNRDTCPICNHIDALEYYKLNDDEKDYMFRFSEDRQKRLTIRERDDVSREDYPFDFYYQYPDIREQELSSEIIDEMFNLKLLLEDSIENTKSRIDLFHYVFDIYTNKETYLLDCNSKLYSLIYYLSYEVHWLQKEPFVFRDFRVMLSEISIYVAILDINELTRICKENNTHKISPIDCATRYKYSAISLLRSTDKLKFCENVGQIILSSNFKNRYSNNLIQNSFYHTFSIYKNKYNKSRNYFNRLIESYKKLINLQELSDDQKNTANELYNRLSSKLVEFDIDKLDDLGLIREWKREYYNNYKTQDHPPFQKRMGNIMLSSFSNEGINDIKSNGTNSDFYKSFTRLAKNIYDDWQSVRLYLNTKIKPYYHKLSLNFKNSFTFCDDLILFKFFEATFDENGVNQIDKFSRLVSLISSNELEYMIHKIEYDRIHSSLFENILKEDSVFNQLLEQFPLKVNEILKEKLEHKFPKLLLEAEKDFLAFYPTHRFEFDLMSIVDNISCRLNEDLIDDDFNNWGVINNINIGINISEDVDFISIKISYDGTDKKNLSHEHKGDKKGGLDVIEKEIRNFGGKLKYEKNTNDLGIFNIEIKLRKYE